MNHLIKFSHSEIKQIKQPALNEINKIVGCEVEIYVNYGEMPRVEKELIINASKN